MDAQNGYKGIKPEMSERRLFRQSRYLSSVLMLSKMFGFDPHIVIQPDYFYRSFPRIDGEAMKPCILALNDTIDLRAFLENHSPEF